MKITDVPTKYRVLNAGEHNLGIYVCCHCHENVLGAMKAIGFAEVKGFLVVVFDCPKCFKRFHYHCSDDTYEMVLSGWRVAERKKQDTLKELEKDVAYDRK
jgi:hypothetical protein